MAINWNINWGTWYHAANAVAGATATAAAGAAVVSGHVAPFLGFLQSIPVVGQYVGPVSALLGLGLTAIAGVQHLANSVANVAQSAGAANGTLGGK